VYNVWLITGGNGQTALRPTSIASHRIRSLHLPGLFMFSVKWKWTYWTHYSLDLM